MFHALARFFGAHLELRHILPGFLRVLNQLCKACNQLLNAAGDEIAERNSHRIEAFRSALRVVPGLLRLLARALCAAAGLLGFFAHLVECVAGLADLFRALSGSICQLSGLLRCLIGAVCHRVGGVRRVSELFMQPVDLFIAVPRRLIKPLQRPVRRVQLLFRVLHADI